MASLPSQDTSKHIKIQTLKYNTKQNDRYDGFDSLLLLIIGLLGKAGHSYARHARRYLAKAHKSIHWETLKTFPRGLPSDQQLPDRKKTSKLAKDTLDDTETS